MLNNIYLLNTTISLDFFRKKRALHRLYINVIGRLLNKRFYNYVWTLVTAPATAKLARELTTKFTARQLCWVLSVHSLLNLRHRVAGRITYFENHEHGKYLRRIFQQATAFHLLPRWASPWRGSPPRLPWLVDRGAN